MIVFDAHAHAGDEAERKIRQRLGIRTLLSCGNVPQALEGQAICRAHSVFTAAEAV